MHIFIGQVPAEPVRASWTGGTRFIGVYLARQLLEEGHQVTLLTRGKKPTTFQIPDDTDDSFAKFEKAVQHIAADRTNEAAVQKGLEGKKFQGTYLSVAGFWC